MLSLIRSFLQRPQDVSAEFYQLAILYLDFRGFALSTL